MTTTRRRRRLASAVIPLAILTTLATGAAAGGCGGPSDTKPNGYTTNVKIQGNPAAAHKCKTTLTMLHPANKQITATYTVTCNFPLASASTSLVIQGRHLGSDSMSWQNLGDPRLTSATSGISLTYKVPCITSLEYQASASIDGVGADGSPVSTLDTTTPKSYSASQCTQG